MQNGFVESFNGRLRDECLNEHLFRSYAMPARSSRNGAIDYNLTTDRTRASTGSPFRRATDAIGGQDRLSISSSLRL
jgi:putative transposase